MIYKSSIFLTCCGFFVLGLAVLQDSNLVLIGGMFTFVSGVILQVRLEFDARLKKIEEAIHNTSKSLKK